MKKKKTDSTSLFEKLIARTEGDYEGILSEPLFSINVDGTLLTSEPPVPPENIHTLVNEKLKALFDHFAIDPNSPEALKDLVICLAVKHVPGFQAKAISSKRKKRIGRPPTWKMEDGLKLYADVANLIEKDKERKKGLTPYKACMHLASNPKYGVRYESYNGRGLYRRHKEIIDGDNELAKGIADFLLAADKEGVSATRFFIKQFALKID